MPSPCVRYPTEIGGVSDWGKSVRVDFETVVKKQRMCREFLDRKLPHEKVDRILHLAYRYPSSR
jgi:hypothetical protein